MSRKQNIVSSIMICGIVLVSAALLILLSKASPLEAGVMFFQGILGSFNGIGEIIVKATPLILTGLGCCVAFKTGFFNIGAEGQFYMGAVAAAYVSLTFTSLPGIVRILLSIVAGFLAGGFWAFLAAVMKSKMKISEIIVTIMLNYIAINFVGVAVRTFLMDPAGSVPQSSRIAPEASFPLLLPPTRINAGFFLAVFFVFLIWFLMEKSTIGYEMKVVGFNKRAAKCNGISDIKNIILSAILSGGLAGLAGVIEVLGIQKKLLEGISSGCGYTAVLIALMASNHPIGVFALALGYAAMQVGANSMQRQLGIPSAIVDILMGLMVLLILSKQIFKVSVERRQR